MDRDEAIERAKRIEAGEAPADLVLKVTGSNSLSSPGPGGTPRAVTTYNVCGPVVALVNASSPGAAIAEYRTRLRRAGFEPLDDDPSNPWDAVVSEVQHSTCVHCGRAITQSQGDCWRHKKSGSGYCEGDEIKEARPDE